MTDLRALLAPIRERLEVITPLPWIDWDRGIGHEIRDQYGEPINSGHRETFSARDADFIANAPTDQAKLLAAIEAVAGLHKPGLGHNPDCNCGIPPNSGRRCQECGDEWPCETVTALVAALGSDTTNQEGTQ